MTKGFFLNNGNTSNKNNRVIRNRLQGKEREDEIFFTVHVDLIENCLHSYHVLPKEAFCHLISTR